MRVLDERHCSQHRIQPSWVLRDKTYLQIFNGKNQNTLAVGVDVGVGVGVDVGRFGSVRLVGGWVGWSPRPNGAPLSLPSSRPCPRCVCVCVYFCVYLPET